MILYLFITCIPFFIFIKSLLISLNLKPLPLWARTTSEARLLLLLPTPPLFLFKYLTFSLLNPTTPNQINENDMSFKRKLLSPPTTTTSSEIENDTLSSPSWLFELPELALDCILEKLSPKSLCSMAGVCSSMRERCSSDRLWESHMKRKWGRVISQDACREWPWRVIASSDPDFEEGFKNDNNNKSKNKRQMKSTKGIVIRILSLGWPFSWIIRPNDDDNNINDHHHHHGRDMNNLLSPKKKSTSLTVDSIVARYLALETGKFCFPAQVYNREYGHVGFMLSCYDAQISYDLKTDTFQARYPPHGRRAMAVESGVPWERVRAPPVETPPHALHISDCLHELRPGNHFEIQWRRNKDFPYGWWYGVVGHLESCDGNENYCRCHDSDTVVLEFSQYMVGSRWRHTIVNRKDHREVGNEADGFYAGIRKLRTDHEISVWKQLWPAEALE